MGVMPYGAIPILKARQQGKKPADMVLVSMIGALPAEANPVVIADKALAYDWEWMRGLNACFWASPKGYIAKHILEAAKARPAAMYLWDCANEKGYDLSVLPSIESIELPQLQWDWRIHADRWLPFQEEQFASGEMVWS